MDNILNLPDSLKCADGTPVTSVKEWENIRRPEILELFEKHVYGRIPEGTVSAEYRTVEEGTTLNDKALRRQVCITLSGNGHRQNINLLLILPVSDTPVPVFTMLNFQGNQIYLTDKEVFIPDVETADGTKPSDKKRGMALHNFSVENIIDRGYAIATAIRSDIDPDYHDGFRNGVHPLLQNPEDRGSESWGTISAWAWGLSRILDYCETCREIDQTRVIAIGHSRLGKTALWAGALDRRFAMAISNNSGCGGASLSKHVSGETVEMINSTFPHWFCDTFRQYNGKEENLPVDQHMLIALMAPMPVYAASAEKDLHADPEGEFLSCVHASPVYNLYGLKGLETSVKPGTDTPLTGNHIGYHIRPGEHSLTQYDWDCYLDFADIHLGTEDRSLKTEYRK